MPKIQEFTPRQSILPEAPPSAEIQPFQFGATGDSIDKVGQGAADFGADLLRKRQDAQDYTDASKQALDDTLWAQDLAEKTKLTTPENGKGYYDAVKSAIDDRFESNQQAFGTQYSKQLYQQQASRVFTNALLDAQSYENKKIAIGHQTDFYEDSDRVAEQQATMPDLKTAYQADQVLQTRLQSGKGTLWSEEQASDMSDQQRESFATSYLNGLYEKAIGDQKNGQTFFKQGLAFLKGHDPESQDQEEPLKDALSSDQITSYLDKFSRALQQHREVKTNLIHMQANDQVAAGLQGIPVNPGPVVASIKSAMAQGSMDLETGMRQIDRVQSAAAASDLIRQMNTSSAKDWPSIVSKFDTSRQAYIDEAKKLYPGIPALQDPNFNAGVRLETLTRMDAAQSDILKQRTKDPAQYVLDNFPGVDQARKLGGNDAGSTQAYIQTLFSHQSELGMQNRVTTKNEAANIGAMLSQQDPQKVNVAFGYLEQKYGPYASRVFNETMDDKQIDSPALWVAHYASGPASRQALINTVVNKKEIEDAFKNNPKSTVEEVNTTAREKASSLYAAFGQSGDGSYDKSNALQQALTLQAKNLMVKDSSLGVNQAVDAAKKQIIDANFTMIPGPNSRVAMPNNEGRPQFVQAFMESHLDQAAFPEMNLKLPTGDQFDKLPEAERQARFYSNLEKNGRWVTSPSGDGIQLQLLKVNGTYVTVSNNQGRPVEYKYQDISNNPDPKTLSRARRGVSRLFEKISDAIPGTEVLQ